MDLTGLGHWIPGAAVLLTVLGVSAYAATRDPTVPLLLSCVAISHLLLDLVTGVEVWPDAGLVGPLLGRRDRLLNFVLEGVVILGGWLVYVAFSGRRLSRWSAVAMLAVPLAGQGLWNVTRSLPPVSRDRQPFDPATQLPMVVGLAVVAVLLLFVEKRGRTVAELEPHGTAA